MSNYNDDILNHYGIAKTASRTAFQQELVSLGINPRSAAAITEMVAASRVFQSKTASEGLPSGFIKDAEYMLCAGLKKHFGKGTKNSEPDEGDNEEALEHEDDEDKESELKLGHQTTKLAYALAKHYGADEVQALTASMYAYTKLPPKPRAKTAKVEFKQYTGEMLRLWVTQAGQGSMKAADAPGKANEFSKKVSDAMSNAGLFLRFKLNDVWVESVGRGGLAFTVVVDAKLQEDIDVWDNANLKALKGAFKAQGISF